MIGDKIHSTSFVQNWIQMFIPNTYGASAIQIIHIKWILASVSVFSTNVLLSFHKEGI